MTKNKLDIIIKSLWPGSRLIRAWPLKGGISATMTAVEIGDTTCQRKKAIIRQYNQNHLQKIAKTAENQYKMLQLTQEQ